MVKCIGCGKDLHVTAQFCTQCGAVMSKNASNVQIKTGFNWWACFFPIYYLAGKNHTAKALKLTLIAWYPLCAIAIGIYYGFKANKIINESEFNWSKAVSVGIIPVIILAVVKLSFNGGH